MSDAGTGKAMIGSVNLSVELGSGAVAFIEDSLGKFTNYNRGSIQSTQVHILTPLSFIEEIPFKDSSILEYRCEVIPNLNPGFTASQMPKTFPTGMLERLKKFGKVLAPRTFVGIIEQKEGVTIEHNENVYRAVFIYKLKKTTPQD